MKSSVHGELMMEIRLRPVELSDVEFIFQARREGSRNQFLSPVNGTVEDQRDWLKGYLRRFEAGEEYYFIIEDYRATPWGMIRLYHIDRGRRSFTIGSWLLMPGAPLMAAQESVAQGYEYGFRQLDLDICRFEVMLENRKVIRFHRCYAKEIARDDKFIYFEFTRDMFEKSIFQQFLVRCGESS